MFKGETVPHDMRECNIVTLCKNKGNRSDCNSYRGIFLLKIVGKVFSILVPGRLLKLAESLYLESQFGLRSKRSTIYMIFRDLHDLRQLQEK